jgi:hypothetical protein
MPGEVNPKIPKRIVAEVSKSWVNRGRGPGSPEGSSVLLSQKFENVIETNRERGYALESWEMTATGIAAFDGASICETIVAVFVLVEGDHAENPPQ